ncbi:CLI_3235 family bacteriocin precursor [Clostridium botulinum]|nr:CLI_3235 family bacteriocin precursor [Clostridium botulinum]
MKKLGKKINRQRETIKAYDTGCGGKCTCSCICSISGMYAPTNVAKHNRAYALDGISW